MSRADKNLLLSLTRSEEIGRKTLSKYKLHLHASAVLLVLLLWPAVSLQWVWKVHETQQNCLHRLSLKASRLLQEVLCPKFSSFYRFIFYLGLCFIYLILIFFLNHCCCSQHLGNRTVLFSFRFCRLKLTVVFPLLLGCVLAVHVSY